MAYQSEIEKLEQRYEENPQQWFAALADAYRKDGSLDLALEYVRGGLEMRPNYASGYIVLGRCLIEKNEHTEAAQAFEQVLELDAENIIALKSLSEIAELRNDIPAAKSWLERLLEVDPMNDEARETLERLAAMPEISTPATPPEEDAEEEPVAPTPEPGAAWAAEAMAQKTPEVRMPDEGAAEPKPTSEVGTPEQDEDAFEVEQLGAVDPFKVDELPDYDRLEPDAAGEDGASSTSGLISVEPDEAPLASFGDVVDYPPANQAAPDEPAEAPATNEHAEVPISEVEPAALEADAPNEPLGLTSFDDSLAWDTGDRLSHEISQADIAEAEVQHEELAPAVDFMGVEGVVGQTGEDSDRAGVAESADGTSAERDTAPDSAGPHGVLKEPEEPSGPEEPPEPEPVSEAMQFVTPEVRIPVSQEAETQKIRAVVAGESHTETDPRREPEVEREPEPGAAIQPEAAAEEPRTVPAEPRREGAEAPAAAGALSQGESSVAEDEADLPLIMPEDVAPRDEQLDEEGAGTPEPRPVVTETMAEVYAQQGLYQQARQTYQKLLAERPDDAALQARFDEMTKRVQAISRQSRSPKYSVAETGGPSAVTFLQQVFAGEATDDLEPLDLPAADEPPAEWIEPATSTLESTFGAEPPDADAPGSPTVPAADEVSLSSVFGESAPPSAADSSPDALPPEPQPRASGGVSFDEFYGQSKAEEPAEEEGAEGESTEEERSEDDFRDWLEGLKT